MAIAPSAVWRVRPNGSALNGAGYDGTSYPGGTDYSRQDTAQATWANLSCTGSSSTTLTDASGGNKFTAAMPGNAMFLTGGSGFTQGYYFVASRTDANNVVLDRSPASGSGAATGGSARLGGAADTPRTLASGGPLVPGNWVYCWAFMGTDGWDETALAAALSSNATTMTISAATASNFPGTGSFAISIETELLLVTAGAGSTTWTVTRGYQGSTAAAHATNTRVALVDYAAESQYGPASGDATNGYVHYVGENGRPHVSVASRWFDNPSHVEVASYLVSIRSAPGFSVIYAPSSTFRSISLDFRGVAANNPSSISGSFGGSPTLIVDCEVWGGTTGALSNSGNPALYLSNGSACINSRVHAWAGPGIVSGDSLVMGCVVSRCAGTGIQWSGSTYNDHAGCIAGNTIVANGSHGIDLQSPGIAGACVTPVYNNLVTDHTAAGACGINAYGTKAQNVGHRPMVDFNFLNNNTAHYSASTAAGPHDVVGVDPGYVDPSYTRYPNYSIGTALKAQAFNPRSFGPMRSYVDPGAVQRQEPTGGGGGIGPTLTVAG